MEILGGKSIPSALSSSLVICLEGAFLRVFLTCFFHFKVTGNSNESEYEAKKKIRNF